MATIEAIGAREILDSRGNPTVEVEVALDDGTLARAAVPSGASTGAFEANELRDGDPKRYGGKGVEQAVENVNETIAEAIQGYDVTEQRLVDQAMLDLDGTPEKSNLGANAILGVSLAVAKAAADSAGLSLFRYVGGPNAHVLPVPMMNIMNGGAHADSNVDVQEFMVAPIGAPTYREALRGRRRGLPRAQVGAEEEGLRDRPRRRGWLRAQPAAQLGRARPDRRGRAGGRLLARQRHRARPRRGRDRVLRERHLHVRGRREVHGRHDRLLCAAGRLLPDRVDRGPAGRGRLGRLEGAHRAAGRAASRSSATTSSSPTRSGSRAASRTGTANAVLVKVNQIGTLTETLDAVDLAHRAGYKTMISHRSGETEDTTIADLAVAVGSGQIKTGAPARSERVAKFNQLLRIEEELDDAARYAGRGAFPRYR